MIETHPFGNFVPPNARYLILGSFAARQAVQEINAPDGSYNWFYGTKRNQFWSILEEVYGLDLKSTASRKELFSRMGIAITDIILQCERKNNTAADTNLKVITYNIEAIAKILDSQSIRKIFFTSRFVEVRFKKIFTELIHRHPDIELITLPSPSPRYAKMNKEQKTIKYKELLPNF